MEPKDRHTERLPINYELVCCSCSLSINTQFNSFVQILASFGSLLCVCACVCVLHV